jgi:hypothetical protein
MDQDCATLKPTSLTSKSEQSHEDSLDLLARTKYGDGCLPRSPRTPFLDSEWQVSGQLVRPLVPGISAPAISATLGPSRRFMRLGMNRIEAALEVSLPGICELFHGYELTRPIGERVYFRKNWIQKTLGNPLGLELGHCAQHHRALNTNCPVSLDHVFPPPANKDRRIFSANNHPQQAGPCETYKSKS